ncbi:MAG: glycosyl hydrolase [Rhodothermales bacterium]
MLQLSFSPERAVAQEKEKEVDLLTRAIGGLKFRSIGPAAISGRISDIAIHPDHPSTWYLATASGGLWKTDNAGTTFRPIADGEGSYSFGVIAIDPNNPNVIWAGSGENNPQRSVSYGDGVYKSLNGGRSWKNVGLDKSEHIARILIDPRDSDVVYVASQGPLWNAGGERGLYKTTDGGETWAQVMEGIDEWTGVADAVMDPNNPDVLLAATWQRARRQWSLIAGGPKSALYRSEDGGATWEKSSGMPGGQIGRIGLAISPADSDVVYAIAESTEKGGFYRSTNNGINFQRMSDRVSSSNYYQELFVDPNDPDRVFSVSTVTAVSHDGGENWENLGLSGRHVDDHVVWVDPEDAEHLLIGGDGGLYQTFDAGATWDWFQNLPLAQFYRIEVDSTRPFYRIYGGTQDNSTLGGPSRTTTRRGADTGDWFLTQGGDGFVTRIDPTDQNIVYSESQYAGMTRFNLATGERVSIQPLPEPGEPALRWHWDTPLLISPHNPARLYAAAQRVFRSDDRGSNWQPISDDLTAQIDRNSLKLMGRVWSVDAMAKNRSTSTWNSIVSMSESTLQEGLIWVGTDDGVMQVTEDGGGNWRQIQSIRGIPDTTFVSSLVPSSHDVNTVYASFDNHKAGDFKPYIAKSTDLGKSWDIISSDLPEKGTVYVLKEDHKNPAMLYAGTEYGVFFSNNYGESWRQLKKGLPTIMVADIAIQKQHDDLVLGTFGRGFYVLDDFEILRSLTEETLAQESAILPVSDASLFVPSSPDPGWQGSRFWTADNPPAGASIYYHLKEASTTRESRRKKEEAKARKAGEDVFYPSWESLKAEDVEEDPQVIVTITDAEGRVVRRLKGSASAGLHNVNWDLRYPSSNPGGTRGSGPYVVPGMYAVSLSRLVDGEVEALAGSQTFNVVPLLGEMTPRTPQVVAFQKETARLQRAVMGASAALNEAMERSEALQKAITETPADVSDIHAELNTLAQEMREVRESLSGDPTKGRRNEPSDVSLMRRMSRITGGAWSGSIQEVTGTQRRQYEIVSDAFGDILSRLRQLIDGDLKRIEDAAEAAGVPWTSGRLPVWEK